MTNFYFKKQLVTIGVRRIFFRGGQLSPFRESYKENIKIFFYYSDFMRAVAPSCPLYGHLY